MTTSDAPRLALADLLAILHQPLYMTVSRLNRLRNAVSDWYEEYSVALGARPRRELAISRL